MNTLYAQKSVCVNESGGYSVNTVTTWVKTVKTLKCLRWSETYQCNLESYRINSDVGFSYVAVGSKCLCRLKLRVIKHTHTHTLGGWYYEFQWNTEVTNLKPTVDEPWIGTSFNATFLPACWIFKSWKHEGGPFNWRPYRGSKVRAVPEAEFMATSPQCILRHGKDIPWVLLIELFCITMPQK